MNNEYFSGPVKISFPARKEESRAPKYLSISRLSWTSCYVWCFLDRLDVLTLVPVHGPRRMHVPADLPLTLANIRTSTDHEP